MRPGDRYGWNEVAQRYVDNASGRFVSVNTVRQELERTIETSRERVTALTEKVISGEISIESWQLSMEREVKAVQVAGGVTARGGWNQMSPSDWGYVGSQTQKQYKYLRRFAKDLESGKQPANGQALARARMYAESGRATFEAMARRQAAKHGKKQERRVLGPVKTEHCTSDGELTGCMEIASMGWVPINTLPPIGQSPCYSHCHCHFEYR